MNQRNRTLAGPWSSYVALLALVAACGGDKDDPVTDTDTDTDSDTDADTDTDTDADSDTDTDTDTVGTFSLLSDTPDLVETIDVAATDAALWAVGFNGDGEASVVSVNLATGAITELHAGAPLVQPTGLAVSPDGATLYVADLAAAEGDGSTNGEVYSLPSSGGTPTAIGTADTIDLPGDVAVSTTGDLWVSGMNTAGEPALFSVVAGAVSEEFSGAPLMDPLAIAASPDGSKLYVVDSMGESGSGAVFSFATAGFADTLLVMNFRVEFPGGIAVDPADTFLYYTQTNTTPGSTAPMTGAALVRIATDGSGWQVVSDTPTSLVLPGGAAAISAGTYVGDQSSLALGDVFSYIF